MKLPPTMRLNRLIALCSPLSRRAADTAIVEGRVTVNGTIATTLATIVKVSQDRVTLDGKFLRLPEHHTTVILNKPAKMLVTKSDPQGRPTIWSLLGDVQSRLDAAGRLDYDAEGLLILSTDGDLLQRISHPKHELWKVYEVKMTGKPSADVLKKLADGIDLDEGRTLPARVKRVRTTLNHTWVEISIREGKYRQLKKMCDAVGHRLLKLKRLAVGPLHLGHMKSGKWRYMTPKELRELEHVL